MQQPISLKWLLKNVKIFMAITGRSKHVLAGEKLNSASVLIDFGELKEHVSKIMETLDHKFLNELEFFDDGNPSSENIACYIAKELGRLIDDDHVNVSRITVWESENASATYIP